MITVPLWAVVLGLLVLFLASRALRKVQLFWLRNTSLEIALRRIEWQAFCDAENGIIGARVLKAIRWHLNDTRQLSVVGWRRDRFGSVRDESFHALLDLELAGSDIAAKFGEAAAESATWWARRQQT